MSYRPDYYGWVVAFVVGWLGVAVGLYTVESPVSFVVLVGVWLAAAPIIARRRAGR